MGSFKSLNGMGKTKLIPNEKNWMIQKQVTNSNMPEVSLSLVSKCT